MPEANALNNEQLKQIAGQFGTPSYVFDLDAFAARIGEVRRSLPDHISICYAMKANPFLTEVASLFADSLEVCSPGEFAICKSLSIPPDKLVLSGVNKTVTDLLDAVDYGKGMHYTVESPAQAMALSECAVNRGMSHLPVLLRLTSGNQFGMDEDTLLGLARDLKRYPGLFIEGLQYYSGTQKRKAETLEKELALLDGVAGKLRELLPYPLSHLEYGPGLPITYFQNDGVASEETLLSRLSDALNSLRFEGAVTLELGRFLAAGCGCYLTRVADSKCSLGQSYLIVDGGCHHLNYYGQMMAMKHPFYRHITMQTGRQPGVTDLYTICGSLCTSADMIVKHLKLTDVLVGDLLVFERVGAYSVTEGISLFLSRNLPQIIFYSGRDGAVLARDSISTWPLNQPPQINLSPMEGEQ